jgi:hypothetical protein
LENRVQTQQIQRFLISNCGAIINLFPKNIKFNSFISSSLLQTITKGIKGEIQMLMELYNPIQSRDIYAIQR